jgi:hypothetical protein
MFDFFLCDPFEDRSASHGHRAQVTCHSNAAQLPECRAPHRYFLLQPYRKSKNSSPSPREPGRS